MAINYIGLDFEASGSEPWGGHVPIQIGIATDMAADKRFATNIGRWNWEDRTWDLEAFAVHGISKAALAKADPAWKVDIRAANFLLDNAGNSRMWNVIVGWNVAGYDRQFITRWMPNLNRILSYRTVDLNALVFAKAGDNEAKFLGVKNNTKDRAEELLKVALDVNPNQHDAGYDALHALACFDILKADAYS